jgi:hypothetical protein
MQHNAAKQCKDEADPSKLFPRLLTYRPEIVDNRHNQNRGMHLEMPRN